MQIGAIVRSYRLTKYLKPVLRNLKNLDSVVVMNYRFSGVQASHDNTTEIINNLDQKNIRLFKGSQLEQHEIFNRGLRILKDFDFVFIIDADEFVLPKDRERIIKQLVDENTEVAFCCVLDYKDEKHIYPVRKHKPVVCVKPKRDIFYQIRNVKDGYGSKVDVFMHHFGYMMDDKDRKWKEDNLWYADLSEYEKVTGRNPLEQVMPQELRELLNE